MLHGVLLMPPELWSDRPTAQMQRHERYKQASERINEQEQEIARLCKDLDDALETLRRLRECQGISFDGKGWDSWAGAIEEADAMLARFNTKTTEQPNHDNASVYLLR